MSERSLTYERDQKGVGVITLNRPEVLNAMSLTMRRELIDRLRQIDEDPAVRAVVLTGAGKAFCAGGDLSEKQQGYGGAAGFYRTMEFASRLTALLIELSKPVIAAVNGAAMGIGMNMALAADMAIASETARFSESFGNVGLVPNLGGTYLLPRLVGLAKAKELVFTCRTLNAKEALELGIVHRVVPREAVFETAYALAAQMAEGPTFAIALAKRMMNRSFETDLHTALQLEALSEALAGNSQDHEEGLAAFFEKRPRRFTGA